jgi:hypothetical protein
MPRTTVLRKLQYMLKHGYVTQDGSTYAISDTALSTTTPALDRAIKLIHETSDALRAVQNGQRPALVSAVGGGPGGARRRSPYAVSLPSLVPSRALGSQRRLGERDLRTFTSGIGPVRAAGLISEGPTAVPGEMQRGSRRNPGMHWAKCITCALRQPTKMHRTSMEMGVT